ncbi:MAG: hypothetical protein ACRCTJ_03790 [Brevinema sp.]
MKKTLLLLILLGTTNYLYAFSKKPESRPVVAPEPFIQHEYYDRKNKLIHYDLVPFYIEKYPHMAISIQPSISRSTISGQTDLHLWISYTTKEDNEDSIIFTPDFLTIDTLGREMRLPLIYKQTNSTTNNDSKNYTFNSYVYLFTEDIDKLLGVLMDGKKPPIEFWEPDRAEERRNALLASGELYQSSAKKIANIALYQQEKIDFVAKNTRTFGAASAEFYDVPYKTIAPKSSVLIQQKQMTLSLANKDHEVSWEVAGDALWMVLEAIFFKNELANIPLAP